MISDFDRMVTSSLQRGAVFLEKSLVHVTFWMPNYRRPVTIYEDGSLVITGNSDPVKADRLAMELLMECGPLGLPRVR